MIDIATIVKIRECSFFKAAQRTLVMLMPIAMAGSYFKLLHNLVFAPDGLIYNIFGLDQVISDQFWYTGSFISAGMVEVTFGIFGLYACYFMAQYTARIYYKDSSMAGITAVLFILFCAYASSTNRNTQQLFSENLLQINAVFIALVIGYGVGLIYRFLGKDYQPVKDESTRTIQSRVWQAALPACVCLILSIILGIFIYDLKIKLLNSTSFNELINRVQITNNLWEVMLLTVVITFLNWLGIGFPVHALSGTINNAHSAENLTYALQHGNSWQVPYQFLGSSLINNYAMMGGSSVTLAIIVILMLRHENKEIVSLTKISLLPAAFNSTLGFTVGLPIMLNPVFLLPSILIPLFNLLIAASAISLRLIPVSVYPILKGTPGLLVPFFGTNGNWETLIFTILLFLSDIGLLWPIIKLSERVSKKLSEATQENVNE